MKETSEIIIDGKKGTLKIRGSLFWDVDVKKITAEKNTRLIIERVFTRGNTQEFSRVMKYYDEDVIKRIILNAGSLDKKTLNFASQILKIDKTEFRCYKKKQSIITHWH